MENYVQLNPVSSGAKGMDVSAKLEGVDEHTCCDRIFLKITDDLDRPLDQSRISVNFMLFGHAKESNVWRWIIVNNG